MLHILFLFEYMSIIIQNKITVQIYSTRILVSNYVATVAAISTFTFRGFSDDHFIYTITITILI